MARTLAILTLAAVGVVASYAGPLGINPGNVLNPDGTVSIGLLPSNPAAGNSGAGPTGGVVGGVCNPTTNPDCITTNGTLNGSNNFVQRNLVSNAFMLNGGNVSPNLPDYSGATCAQNCQNTIYSPPNKPEFEMLGDGTSGTGSSNIWYSVSTGTGSGSAAINVPIGIFGVSAVSTMLNTVAGLTTGGTICTGNGGLNPQANCSNTAAYATITLNFNSAVDGSGTSASESFALINGVTQRNLFAGIGGGASSLASGGTYNVIDPFNSQSYAVNVGNEWTGTVSGSQTTAINNQSMYLDYQTFPVFSEYQNLYLTSISITDTGTTTTNHEMLSAMTVNVATPEPATAMTLFSGLVILCFAWYRHRKV